MRKKKETCGKNIISIGLKYVYLYLMTVFTIMVIFSVGMYQAKNAYIDRQKQYVQERIDNIILETKNLLEPYYQFCEDIAANESIVALSGRKISNAAVNRVQDAYDDERLAELGIRQIAIYFSGSNTVITKGKIYENAQINDFYGQYDDRISSGFLCDKTGSVYRNVMGSDFRLLIRKIYGPSGIIGCLILDYDFKGIEMIDTENMFLCIGGGEY